MRATLPGAALGSAIRASRRALVVLLGLAVFLVSLELLKSGARGLTPLLRALDVSGLAGGVGFGWLMACLVLSGSPVAAIALALLASRALTLDECFAMIVGSRLGASFVVLGIGVLDDLRSGRAEKRSAYIGVTALIVTAVTYLPSMALALFGLRHGWLEGLRLDARPLQSLGGVAGPAAELATRHLAPPLSFLAGVLLLLGAFRLFDSVLPELGGRQARMARVGEVLYKPWFMFALGLAATALTLSVSVSLSLLVPLAARGYVRRENVCPFILGANITTFVDTLLAAALVGHPEAVRVVALLVASVTSLSLPLVFLVPHAFARAVDRLARRATADARSLLVFVGLLLLAPALLIAL